ncbi:MAG: hypothetical protein BWY74_01232 [Firmicutes bacterium ADurb.Bin419]|nr:MAG: hypothetical protein BWY74_01232 [Firmicutes bacterium ADurb.Bin419]
MNVVAILLMILGVLFFTIGCWISILFAGTGIILLVVGIILLMYWSTKNYKWECPGCGNRFSISLKENIFGLNQGVNEKELICPKCLRKGVCKGVNINTHKTI